MADINLREQVRWRELAPPPAATPPPTIQHRPPACMTGRRPGLDAVGGGGWCQAMARRFCRGSGHSPRSGRRSQQPAFPHGLGRPGLAISQRDASSRPGAAHCIQEALEESLGLAGLAPAIQTVLRGRLADLAFAVEKEVSPAAASVRHRAALREGRFVPWPAPVVPGRDE